MRRKDSDDVKWSKWFKDSVLLWCRKCTINFITRARVYFIRHVYSCHNGVATQTQRNAFKGPITLMRYNHQPSNRVNRQIIKRYRQEIRSELVFQWRTLATKRPKREGLSSKCPLLKILKSAFLLKWNMWKRRHIKDLKDPAAYLYFGYECTSFFNWKRAACFL